MGILDFLKKAGNTTAPSVTNSQTTDTRTQGQTGDYTKAATEAPSETPDTCCCEQFTEEFADEITFDNFTKGVAFRTSGDNLRITYSGLLAKSGAQQVYAVVGYGSNEDWQNVQTLPMNNAGGSAFELSVPAEETARVNVVFRDAAGNWDNNSGKNYSFILH